MTLIVINGKIVTVKIMNTIMMLVAVMFFVAAIIVGAVTDSTWRNCIATWALLLIGITVFGIVLTL